MPYKVCPTTVLSPSPRLPDQVKSRKSIALLAREQGARELVEMIQDWPQKKRFFAAMECAQNDPLNTFDTLPRFHLSPKQEQEVCLRIVRCQPNFIELLDSPGFNGNAAWEAVDLFEWGMGPCADRAIKPIRRINQLLYSNKEQLSIVKKVLAAKDKELLLARCQFVAVAMFMLHYLVDDHAWVEKRGLLDAIYDFRRPNLRFPLLDLFLEMGGSKEGRACFDALPQPSEKAPWQKLTHLSYAVLLEQGVPRCTVDRMIALTEARNSRFKNYLWHIPLIETLGRLAMSSVMSADEKKLLLDRFDRDDPKEVLRQVRAANSLFVGRNEALLVDQTASLSEHAGAAFQKALGLKEIDDVATRVFETFGSSREPSAIFRYSAKILSLGDEKSAQLLRLFVRDVLTAKFIQNRYDLTKSKHLRSCFGKNPSLLDRWKLGIQAPVEDLLGERTIEGGMKFLQEALLKSKMVDLRKLPLLTLYLQTGSDQITKECHRQAADLARIPVRLRREDEKEQLRFLALQKALIALCEKKDLAEALPELKGARKKLLRAGFEGSQFHHLLSDKITEIAQAKKGKYLALDSDNPYDLLLAGTEVNGSCQHVDFDPHYSVCLLGYLLNGRNRILRIAESESGPTVARCMLRVILDDQNRPILLREKLYPSNITHEHARALKALAKRKGEEMGLPVVSLYDSGEMYSYAGGAKVKKGRSPFEYADSGPGKVTDGKYLLNSLYCDQ